MSKPRAIIFANGHLPDLEAASCLIHPDDFLIAADGGTRHALALGLMPSIIIGDLDSLTPDDRQRLEGSGVEIRQHPFNKDETDLELALDLALDAGFKSILILAALGGRLDQTLGNLALLTPQSLGEVDVRLDDGVEEAFFIHTQDKASPQGASRKVDGRPGDTVSLIPWGRPVKGVRTEGLRWPLRGDVLYPDKTRGISNELLGETAYVAVQSGLLLIIHRRSI